MNLSDLQPTNTKKAKKGAVNAFMRFLGDQHVDMSAVDAAIRADLTGEVLTAVLDRFGFYLIEYKTSAGKNLARHSTMQYFRQAKLWLLGRFPRLASQVEKALFKKGRYLEGFCMKRPSGKMVKQASACTKNDLRLLMRYLYATASTPVDFQDVGLLALLWYLFGRASDLTLLQKSSLSLCSENVFFARFVRMKTSDEQGLTLFPDASPITCPLTAVAVALAFQMTPLIALLPHLPIPTEADFELGTLPVLSAILAGQAGSALLVPQGADNDEGDDQMGGGNGTPLIGGGSRGQSAPGIHAYVNRVLNRIASKAGVGVVLSSHSFRRGGAQHANSSADLTLQWITDRGGWNLTTTNKALGYIFNTTKEDQKVAKVLSGHDVNAGVNMHTLDQFDSVTREKVDRVVAKLFASCVGLRDPQMNVSPAAVNVLGAYLIKAFPQLKALAPRGLLSSRVDEALLSAGIGYDEFLGWASHLAKTASTTSNVEEKPDAKQVELLQHQAAIIDNLIALNKSLADRIKKIEAKQELDASTTASLQTPESQIEDVNAERPTERRKNGGTNLVDVWYSWYTMSAPAMEALDRKVKSDMRQVVAYMRLFAQGYTLDPSDPAFRDTTLNVAKHTSKLVFDFLEARAISARSTGTVLKAMRSLHRSGALDSRINDFTARVDSGIVVDPSPHSQLRLIKFSGLPGTNAL